MQTLLQSTINSSGYIKCGEILKSKNGIQNPYILRCMQCKEIYLLLESFILHLNKSCKKDHKRKKCRNEKIDNAPNEDEVAKESLGCEEPPVKLEQSNVQMVSGNILPGY